MRTPSFPNVTVVGMHFLGEYAKAAVESMEPGCALQLEREPDNRFDSFAIKVLYNNQHIGYLEARQACFIAPWMDEGNEFDVEVTSLEQRKNNLHPIVNVMPV